VETLDRYTVKRKETTYYIIDIYEAIVAWEIPSS
jgi:hypothetical protein